MQLTKFTKTLNGITPSLAMVPDIALRRSSTPARATVQAIRPKRPFTLFRRQEGRVNYRRRQEAGETVARYFVLDAERRWLGKSATGDEGRRGDAGDAGGGEGTAGSGSGSGRGRFALKKGVIDMVGVASSAILGRRGLPAAVTSTSSFSSSSHRCRPPSSSHSLYSPSHPKDILVFPCTE